MKLEEFDKLVSSTSVKNVSIIVTANGTITFRIIFRKSSVIWK